MQILRLFFAERFDDARLFDFESTEVDSSHDSLGFRDIDRLPVFSARDDMISLQALGVNIASGFGSDRENLVIGDFRHGGIFLLVVTGVRSE